MSASCLRKLNKERDTDIKNRLIHTYKSLFRIGINLESRQSYASLIHNGELKIKELLGIQHVLILIKDKDSDKLMKLDFKSTANDP
jgi:hypothetical protein